MAKSEPQHTVFDRVLAFATTAKGFARTMGLPVGKIAPDALLEALSTEFAPWPTPLRAIQANSKS